MSCSHCQNLCQQSSWLLIGCPRVSNQSEARRVSWSISWPWLQLINFRSRPRLSRTTTTPTCPRSNNNNNRRWRGAGKRVPTSLTRPWPWRTPCTMRRTGNRYLTIIYLSIYLFISSTFLKSIFTDSIFFWQENYSVLWNWRTLSISVWIFSYIRTR